MNTRISKHQLLETLGIWNTFLKRRVHLIACGGTALTLLDIKDSTKDIDLIVPKEQEYDYLIHTLKHIGYAQKTGAGWARDNGFVFDLFKGERVHTTQLLESPLKEGNNILFKEYSKIYLGVLNYYDIIITKLFRSSSADIDDCMILAKKKSKEIAINKLIARCKETASYDVSEDKVNRNLENFIDLLAGNDEQKKT